jgi:rubrerythrin
MNKYEEAEMDRRGEKIRYRCPHCGYEWDSVRAFDRCVACKERLDRVPEQDLPSRDDLEARHPFDLEA